MGLASAAPTDLRPSPVVPPLATPPYHKKLRMFLFTTKGRSPVRGSSDPMREAGVSSTRSKLQGCCLECARPTGGSHTRTTRGPAQRRGGRKAKAALSNRGGLEQRGIQHTHYKGRDALKHNSEPGHLGSCAWLIGVGLCRRRPSAHCSPPSPRRSKPFFPPARPT